MKTYCVIDAWSAKDLEDQLCDAAILGYELKFYQSFKDGRMTNEKHFAILEKEAP